MTAPEMTALVPKLPARPRDGHKGTFGTVLVVAGCTGMSGAAALAGQAALRGGAGLVRVAVPGAIAAIVAGHCPCYLVDALPSDREGRLARSALPMLLELAKKVDAVVAGPGLGQSDDVAALVRALCADGDVPLLLDADALNVLGPWPDAWRSRPGPVLVTPHPGEFKRLIGQEFTDRLATATAFAARQKCVVLLKGAGTVVTDGQRAYVNETGNPGMGTGGAGDVLSGLLGALLAQGMAAFDSAVLAAHLHGLAGDLATQELGEASLIATDLVRSLPAAMRRHAGA